MKAAVLGVNGVEIRDVPKPIPEPNQVLVRVRAASLNRADLLVSLGHQHGRVGGVGSRIGLECAGEVEAVGSDVTSFKPGDRVMGSTGAVTRNMRSATLAACTASRPTT